MILHGPTGNVIKGHVLDCSQEGITRALQDYDKQLYIKWNPTKLRGWGCWEIRRKPNEKTLIKVCNTFYKLEYQELDTINHVLDCAFLNYDQVRKIKEMDTWQYSNYGDFLEKQESDHRESLNKKEKEEFRYNLRQHKRYWREFRQMVSEGLNPNLIGQYWK